MLDFQPDDEQQMLAATVERFARERLREAFRNAEEERTVPPDLVQAGWDLGLLASSLPESVGGLGAHSALTGAIAAEQFAWGDLALALSILLPGAVALPIMLCGTPEQQAHYLPLFSGPTPPRVSVAITEPRIDFDARRLATTATPEPGGYRLQGTKTMAPLADSAELFLVYAAEAGQTQTYLVPAGADGLTVAGRSRFMGLQALPTSLVVLDDCRVGIEQKLGGAAGCDFDRLLNHSRVALGAAAVGLARAGYEYARDYARQRVQFGEPIARRQAIAFMLAEMAMDVEEARLLVWEAAWLLDQGRDASRAAALMKHYVDQMVLRVADEAVQTLGGYGYIREFPVELWLRNARGFVNFDGLALI